MTTYRVAPAVSGADRFTHVWKVTPMGRYGAHELVTICPPSPYGVLFANRPGEHTGLADAIRALSTSEAPCGECADLAEEGAK
ncbi:hypothetical protein [Ornithinimicrobium murale]|uniref:hypothetical protein n=1 Tax=Ornithinimicrobium murale TaxID=1050153 RepID=UPI000E0D4E25|nr:hypothetical protein [Ornithinimicrobium murale]